LIGGAAVMVVGPANASELLPTEHYELAFLDKDRRDFVALFEIPPAKDVEEKTGSLQGWASARGVGAEAEEIARNARNSAAGKSPAEISAAVKQALQEWRDKQSKSNETVPKFLMVWDRREFGPDATFAISRESKAYGKPAGKCEKVCVPGKEQPPPTAEIWLPVTWTLTVTNASFPGSESRFTATFTFNRGQVTGEWRLSATMTSWWSSSAKIIPSSSVGVKAFLADREKLKFKIGAGRNLLLKALFWERIEARSDFWLRVDRDLSWAIDTEIASDATPRHPRLYILDIPLEFGRLSLRRLRSDERPEGNGSGKSSPVLDKDCKTQKGARYLFEDQVVHGPKSKRRGDPDGLYGIAEDIWGFTKPSPDNTAKPKTGATRKQPEQALHRVSDFQFAKKQVQGADLKASVQLDDVAINFGDSPIDSKVRVFAAIRHWGLPRHTVAGCIVEPENDARSIGRLRLQHGSETPEGPFEFCGFELFRQEQRDETILTRFRARPTTKESIASLRLGDVCVAALPAVSAAPGAAPRVQSIDVEAHDKKSAREDDVRELVGFATRLSLSSAGITLPERIVPAAGGKPADIITSHHVTRLQFHDADALIYVPALRQAPVSSADAVLPIGPIVQGVKATFDFGRAQLSVIRPNDLLALKYRFSGLELVVPWPPAAGQAPELAPRGGRSTGRPFATANRSEATPRDERPMLVVEFPPQHVVERAYFRQLPPPLDPPELAAAKKEDAEEVEYLKRALLGPKHWSAARFPALDEDAEKRFRLWLVRLRQHFQGPDPDKEEFGSTRSERIAWRRLLQKKAGWPNKSELFPYDPGATRQTIQDFDNQFVKLVAKAGLPEEQQIYAGADFLDPDARRFAIDVLRELKLAQAGPHKSVRQWPELDRKEWARLFEPLIKAGARKDVPAQTRQPGDKRPIWPTFAEAKAALKDPSKDDKDDAVKAVFRATFSELELVRDRINRDYATLRATYRREALDRKGKLKILADHPEYLGPAWYDGLLQELDAIAATLDEEALKEFKAVLTAAIDGSDQDKYEPPAPARLSGPSRIAFRLDCDDYEQERTGGRIPFTLEALTNWGGMDMAVVRRAERLMEPVQGTTRLPPRWGRRALNDEAAILQYQGFTSSRRWGKKVDAFRREPASAAVTAEQRLAEVYASSSRPPDPFETAIELPFRLFLSPAQDATWITSSPRVRRDAGFENDLSMFRELWTARLGGRDDTAGVRAVWSPDYRPEALLSARGVGAPPMGDYAPWALPRGYGVRKLPDRNIERFRTGLESFDRHELVVLSSVHGLPVLGRRAPSGELTADADQIEPPEGFRLQGLLTETVGPRQLDMTAIYRPKPLSVNELSLSALGGNLDIDAAFQPPASARRRSDEGNLFDALSVERWRQRTVLGRDILVEVVYKGFLFPIGHRASLVKLTERRFEVDPKTGSPVAILVQREFIKIGKPEKRFMAEGQPNRGSRWPCERIMMLTRQTPDLVSARSEDNTSKPPLQVLTRGKIALKIAGEKAGEETDAPGICMWPRTAARRGAEVWFEMQIGDEPTPVRMPLIFVDNIAANDDKTVAQLIKYYHDEANFPKEEFSPTRKLVRNGQPVVMAPEYKPSDTTFDTEWWLVGAEGREKEYPQRDPKTQTLALNNTNYVRTSFMEGQDQPAFYPLVERAKCRLKSVERFTGSGPLWGEVAFDGEYVAGGFGEARDDKNGTPKPRNEQSEIYLRIVQSDDGEGTLPLDFKDRGDLAGGVAHPTMDVVAISRQLGPINGGQTAPVLSRPMTAADTPNPPDAPAKPSAGILPLLERVNRFKDSINIVPKGKFLGIMELSDLLEKFLGVNLHPKLNELIEYASASAGGAAAGTLTEVRSLLTKALIAPAEKAIAAVEKAWTDLARKQLKVAGDKKTPPIKDIYPQIGTDLAGLHQLLRDAQNPATDDISFFAELAAIHEAARRLGRSIDNIARDPLAAAATAQLDIFRELSQSINQVRDAINQLKALDLGAILYAQLQNLAKDLLLAQLQRLANSTPADLLLTDQSTPAQISKALVNVRNQVWPPNPPDINGLIELPKMVADRLTTEADQLSDDDAKTFVRNVAKVLGDRARQLDQFVNKEADKTADALRTYLKEKLDRVEPKYKAVIVQLQQDAADAERRARQMMLELLFSRPVARALVIAIEVKTAYEGKTIALPLDIDSLTKLLEIAGPELKALAALSGATRDATRLFSDGAVFCRHLRDALNAGLDAVLPKPDDISVDKPPFKAIDDAATNVRKLIVAANLDPADFDAAYKKVTEAISDLATRITGAKADLRGWAADKCELPKPEVGRKLQDAVLQLRVLASALTGLIDAIVQLVDEQVKLGSQNPKILEAIEGEIAFLGIVLGDAGRLRPLGILVSPSAALGVLADKVNTLKAALPPQLVFTLKSLDELVRDQVALPELEMQQGALVEAFNQLKAVEEKFKTRAVIWDEVKAKIEATKQEFKLQQEMVVRRVERALTAELLELIEPAVAIAHDEVIKILKPFGTTLDSLHAVLKTAIEQRAALEDLMEKRGDFAKRILDELAVYIGAGRDRTFLFKVFRDNDPQYPEALQREMGLVQLARDEWKAEKWEQALFWLSDLSDAWRRPALVVLVQRFNGLSTAFLRAMLVDALDLRALRRELDRIVRELVPSKAILGYTLSTPVRKFGLPGIGDIFLPLKDTKIDIRMQAIIDLQKPTAPNARVDGTMGPFGICLFGNFDVVTLNFHGLEFRSGGGRKSGFDVRFGDFVIGSKAKFLKQLEPFVSPKGGLPPVRPMRDKPGIEASYGINLGSFGVGYLSFSNVSLNAGARLPFGAKEEAEFLISIGRADAPFLISSTVFGGGGYLALLANGKGFIGLETSFDYGGVFAFGFGPLTGAGQITLGLYFRAARGSPARLGMNFMARGAANIACFSICAALMVRLTYSGGKMDGTASYTFSFSYGIDDIDFTFDVYVSQGGSAGAGSPTAFLDLPGMPALTQFAGASRDPLDAYAAALPSPKPSVCEMKGPTLSVKTPSPKADWRSYHSLFDTSLDPPIVKV
jgi:hypothetical protein